MESATVLPHVMHVIVAKRQGISGQRISADGYRESRESLLEFRRSIVPWRPDIIGNVKKHSEPFVEHIKRLSNSDFDRRESPSLFRVICSARSVQTFGYVVAGPDQSVVDVIDPYARHTRAR